MKIKNLSLLVVVAVVLIVLAVFSTKSRHAAPPDEIGKSVLPNLNINAIRSIEMQKGEKKVTLSYTDNVWKVADLFNYPADFSKVRDHILLLANLKIADRESDYSFNEADVTKVNLLDSQNKSLASLKLGPHRQKASGEAGWSMPDGRYISVNDKPQVYLVTDTLNPFDPNSKEWINSELFNIPSSDINTIEFSKAASDGEKESVKLDRSSGSLKLEGLGDQEEMDSSKTYGIESAFSYLRFSDVANPSLSEEVMGFTSGRVFRVALKNGETYTALLGNTPENGSDRYARFNVTLAAATTNDAARVEQEKKVAELNDKLKPWTFLISSYTAGNMSHERKDLVKAKEAATNEAAETSATTAEGVN